MNTEDTKELNEAQTMGERLRLAREQLGFSQQTVAERLCLKVSTVRDIEDNKSPQDLASTFLRGYIRSYARLVHIPEEELLPMMARQTPVQDSKVEVMHSYSLGKRRKKRDGWLMSFTWLILFVVLGLTGAWWWQNHKAQQAELITMDDKSSVEFSATQDEHGVALNQDETPTPIQMPAQPETAASAGEFVPLNNAPDTTSSQPDAAVSQSQTSTDNLQTSTSSEAVPATLPTENANVSAPATGADALNLTFSNDCWLEITDAAGKKLFSGLKRKGETLDLVGHPSYQLKIGAPSAVQIQFQGKPVDMSRFIRTNQVARFTVSAE